MVRKDEVRDNGGNPSVKAILEPLYGVVWIVLGVASLIAQAWWTVTAAACGILFTVMQRPNAPDKPR